MKSACAKVGSKRAKKTKHSRTQKRGGFAAELTAPFLLLGLQKMAQTRKGRKDLKKAAKTLTKARKDVRRTARRTARRLGRTVRRSMRR